MAISVAGKVALKQNARTETETLHNAKRINASRSHNIPKMNASAHKNSLELHEDKMRRIKARRRKIRNPRGRL